MKREFGLIFIILLLFGQLDVFAQPAVIVHPDDVETCSGFTISFSIIATNATIYHWQEHDGSGWYDIEESLTYASGEDTPELIISDAIVGLNNYQYRCRVEDNLGNFVLSNDATLSVWESPLIINNPQDLDVCKTEIAVFTVESLYTSNYQWQENRGTGWYDLENNVFYSGVFGPELSVNTIFGINEYGYRCIVSNNNCTDISNSATLTVYPVPQVFHITGGGSICIDSDGAPIGLNDSELDIAYVLLLDGNSTGQVFSGTGNPIDFGLFYQEGTYTIEAHNPNNGCKIIMLGDAIINHNELPQIFEVSGDGYLCEGNEGSDLTLSGSEMATNYQLIIGGINTGFQLSGTGASLTFENLTTEGIYTVKAISNSGCTSLMEGFVEVSAQASPNIYNVSGSGFICTGTDGIDIVLDNSQEGYFYELYQNDVNSGISLSGTGNELIFENIQSQGIYTIRAENYSTSCWVFMNGQAEIMSAVHPNPYTLEGGGDICDGSMGQAISLSNSQTDCIYKVYRNNVITEICIEGTGSALPLGHFNQSGTYSVKGILLESGCEQWMSNSVEIQSIDLPIVNAGADKIINQGATAQLSGTASMGSGSYTYEWEPVNLLIDASSANTPTIPLYSTQLFTFKVTDLESGCQSLEDTVMVTVGGGLLEVEAITSSSNICEGEQISLVALASGGSGIYNYTWESIPSGFTSNIVNPTATPAVDIKYIVHLFDGTTSVSDTVTIAVNDVPIKYDLIGGGNYCFGSDNVQIRLNGSELQTNYELIRNGINTGISQVGTEDEIIFNNITLSGFYKILATAENGDCSTEMNGNIEINLLPRPVAYGGNNYSTAFGQATTLNGSAFGFGNAYAYEWTPEDLLIETSVQNPQTTPLYSSALFTLTVTDLQSNCRSEADTVLVNISGSTLNIALSTSEDEICSDDNVQLLAIATGGSGEYTYNWSSEPEGFSSGIFNPISYPDESTTYTVTISDGMNEVSASVTVMVNPQPEAFNIGGGGFYCIGDDGVEITLSGSEEGVYYILNHNGFPTDRVLSGTGNSLSFENITNDGSYSIEAFYNEQACHSMMNEYVIVGTNSRPTAFAGSNQIINYNEQAQLDGHGFGGSGYYDYLWSPTEQVVDPELASSLTHNLELSQIFSLVITDQQSACTSIADSITISVSGGELQANAWAEKESICSNEQVQLFALGSGGSGSYNYSWNSIPAGFSSYNYNPVVSPDQTTSYVVTVSDGLNQETKEIEITVNQSPSLSSSSDLAVAYGTNVNISTNASGGAGDYTYIWNPTALITGSNQLQEITTVNLYQDIQFNVKVTDGNNCSSPADTISINVLQLNDFKLTVTAMPEHICKGEEVYLYAFPTGGSGEYSYQWSSIPEGFTNNNFAAYSTVNENTTFNIIVSDGENTIEKNIDVQVADLPETFSFSGNAFLCGEQSETSIELINSESDVDYHLIKDGFGTGNSLTGTGSNISFNNINETGIYSVMAYNQNTGCSQTMNGLFGVDKADLPISFEFSGGGEFCDQQSDVPFLLNGSQTGVLYTLLLDHEATETIRTGTGEFLNLETTATEGNYQLLATNLSTSCTKLMNGNAGIYTYPLPDVYAGEDLEVYSGQTFELQANGEGDIQWIIDGILNENPFSVQAIQSTSYIVQSTNDFGCINSDTIYVSVLEEPSIEVNAFSPNNDGINDTFMDGCMLEIYNRWGQLIFKGEQGWNGEYQKKVVPPGTYFYIRFTDRAGNAIAPIKGTVTVVGSRL
ncbi:MAG: gliding motility-associated C-terminal domain-containing protein [Bacteroidales bacterium]|nr:gliding motility-associated C-terminal domain-containing protein [Bacteroidales bacterium]